MIDVHCHLLYGVDDGAKSFEESVEMLKIAASQGVQGIIVTPHYRHGMFPYEKDKVEAHYLKLKPYAKEMGITMFIGCEYHVNSDMFRAFETGRCHKLGDRKFILTEYASMSEYSYIHQMTDECFRHGLIPVIAHVERYLCLVENPSFVGELQNMGALIQTNADAVLGHDGLKVKRFCKKILKEGYVDIVASDSHGVKHRACHMRECYDYVVKKYSKEYADLLFVKNPLSILKG